jgi:endogenous inhibitor of DNA gyrase (YacG/DUF329 family)
MAGDDTRRGRTQRPCPICKDQPPVPAFRPFCSKRCADVDLSRWLSGSYAIAGREDDEDDGGPEMPGFKGGRPEAANDDHADD